MGARPSELVGQGQVWVRQTPLRGVQKILPRTAVRTREKENWYGVCSHCPGIEGRAWKVSQRAHDQSPGDATLKIPAYWRVTLHLSQLLGAQLQEYLITKRKLQIPPAKYKDFSVALPLLPNSHVASHALSSSPPGVLSSAVPQLPTSRVYPTLGLYP